MGAASIDYGDVANWASVTNSELSAWEAMALVSMSKSYVNQINLADDKNAPSPCGELQEGIDEQAEAEIDAAFAAMGG